MNTGVKTKAFAGNAALYKYLQNIYYVFLAFHAERKPGANWQHMRTGNVCFSGSFVSHLKDNVMQILRHFHVTSA